MSGSKEELFVSYFRNPHRVKDKIYSRVIVGPNNCIIWTGAKHTTGYGVINVQKKNFDIDGPEFIYKTDRVHRVVYEIEVGGIPKEMTIDHLCEVKLCVNYLHLEVVTQKENALRTPKPRITQCPKCSNTDLRINHQNALICTPCTKDYQKNYYLRKRKSNVNFR